MKKIGNRYFYRDFIKKNKDCKISESKYNSIVSSFNKEVCSILLQGLPFKIPYNLGVFEIRKYPTKLEYKNGKLFSNMPIDWHKTKLLWEEDISSKQNKTLIRLNSEYIYKMYYNRKGAVYANKAKIQFKFSRILRRKLKDRIINNEIEAYLF